MPIIRIPDDVMVLQEIFWAYRPQRVVETGVARGGSMLLNAALMRMTGEDVAVLGIDHKLYPHTTTALREHPLAAGVELLEADSTSDDAVSAARAFLGDATRALLLLDSNHTHDHVLGELRALAPLLPLGLAGAGGRHAGGGVPRGALRRPALGPRRQPDDGRSRFPRRA